MILTLCAWEQGLNISLTNFSHPPNQTDLAHTVKTIGYFLVIKPDSV